MKFLNRIDEYLIKQKSNLIGHEEIYNACQKVINLIHSSDNSMSELCDELDIRSISIFHGETGTGKTTLSYSLAKYALEEFGIETFELRFQDIIASELGKTVSNFYLAYEEINQLCRDGDGIILLMDEFDRILIDRKQSNEVSEMKRAFISLMDFLQSISLQQKITVLATTNSFELFDPALKRRFSFQYEIKCNIEGLNEYSKYLSEIIPQSINYTIPNEYIESSKTIAELKQKIRSDLLKFF